ncbi:MAG: hypothetical protein JXJ04_10645 [Spirochaetales bacterium]|nr:hypothetical protein [Spirochaetales bacterium]
MHALNIRNIEDPVYNFLKKESKEKGMSINKLILNILDKVSAHKGEDEYHDLDDFFGTWSDEECNAILEVSGELRAIDEELWK